MRLTHTLHRNIGAVCSALATNRAFFLQFSVESTAPTILASPALHEKLTFAGESQ